jgi:outer membrane immunogenic protein
MAKFSVLAGVALAVVAGSAFAADLPSRKAPPPVYVPPAPSFTWTGLYGGVNIGYAFGNGGNETGAFTYAGQVIPGFTAAWSAPHDLNGVTGGGQVGYNYQFSPWLVVGVEADIQAADINSQRNFFGPGTNPAAPFSPLNDHVAAVNTAKSVDWWGTVRGRVGVTLPSWPNLLIYGTGGFAYGQVDHTVSVADMFVNAGVTQIGRGKYFNTNTGWTAGGGVEWSPLSFPAWSLKVEYLYTDLGSTTIPLAGVLTAGPVAPAANWYGSHTSPTQFHSVRAGVNWHFNPFAASAPVLAKY